MRLRLADFRRLSAETGTASRLWMVPVGLVLAALGQIVAVVVLFPLVAWIAFPDLSFGQAIGRLQALGSRPAVYAFLATFLGPILLLLLWSRFAHKIGPRRLIGIERRFLLRDFLSGVSVVLLVAGVGIAAAVQYQLFIPNVAFADWLPWLLPSLVFIFVQVFAEELVFRGYLQPILAARFRSPLIWLLIPALLFGSLHWQPATFGPNAPLVVAAAVLMGLVAGHVTARTGNISAAVGLHFANNCIGMLVVAVPGDLAALSLYLHPISLEDPLLTRGMLIGNITTIIGAYGIYLWVLRRRDARLKNQPDEIIKTFN